LAVDVGHAQPAAHAQLVEVEVAEERRDDVDGLVEEVRDEHLAADVEVHAAAAPDAMPKPNFESVWPVRTNSCVCASTPGVTRTNTRGTTPSRACRSSRRSSSSKES